MWQPDRIQHKTGTQARCLRDESRWFSRIHCVQTQTVCLRRWQGRDKAEVQIVTSKWVSSLRLRFKVFFFPRKSWCSLQNGTHARDSQVAQLFPTWRLPYGWNLISHHPSGMVMGTAVQTGWRAPGWKSVIHPQGHVEIFSLWLFVAASSRIVEE